jgi:DNA topoisomerase-1
VAILCNHQRTVSKTHAEQMGKIDEQIDSTKEEIQELKKYIKSGKTPKKSKTEDGEKKKSSFPTSVESAEKKIESKSSSFLSLSLTLFQS